MRNFPKSEKYKRRNYMKFSICIDMCFGDLEFDKRIEKSMSVGADAVEFWRWTNKDTDKINTPVAVFNLCSKDENLTNDLLRGILNEGRKEELLSALVDTLPIYKKTVDLSIVL